MFGKLFVVGGILLGLLLPGYTVAVQYSNTINKFLKCQTTKIIEGDSDEDTNYFPSDYTSGDEVADAAAEIAREVEREGLVLLKNDGALPVEEGTRVSCFAQGSVSLNYNSSGSAAGKEGLVKNVLSLDKTDTEKFAYSAETKKPITNLLDDYDINKYENRGGNSVTYVSRNDWQGTLPAENVVLTLDNQKMYDDLSSNKPIEDVGGEDIVYSVDNGLTLAAIRGFDYEDTVWDDFLDQMSFEEQAYLVTNAAFGTVGMENGDIKDTKASDGPVGVIDSVTSTVMPGEGVWASSFNEELIEKVGDIIAEDARINNFDTMYAPGINLHRTPFGGRANEYFSEDPFLTAMAAVAEIRGMQAKGVIPVIKHFVFNDEESARNGISVWLNEQAARELYLLPFEYAMRPSIGGVYGAMSSFNRAGTEWVGASRELQIDIARGEWDFREYFITDMAEGNGVLYMVYPDGIYNGTDLFLGNGSKTALAKWRDNDAFKTRVREAAHRVLYVNANFNCSMNGIASDSRIVKIMPWWQGTLIALICVSAAGTAAALALWGVTFFKIKRQSNK